MHVPTQDPPVVPTAGIIPFSVTDWPDRITATLFTQGCPWRCRYCHNPALQEIVRLPVPQPASRAGGGPPTPNTAGTGHGTKTGRDRESFADFLELLHRRRTLLDGAVISGGEPTVHRELGAAVAAIHGLGLPVGLHTCGYQPKRLQQLLEDPATRPEWIGLDVKALQEDLPDIVGCTAKAARQASRSLDLIRHYCATTGLEAEIRTTVWPGSVVELRLPELRQIVSDAGFDLVVHQAHGVDRNGFFVGDNGPNHAVGAA